MSVPVAIPTLRSVAFVALASWIGLQWVGPVHGATLRVPSEYPTIQVALDRGRPADTVLVAPGTYSGDGFRALTFRGKDMVLLSEDGASMTILDCRGWQCFAFEGGESRSAIVDGFTVVDSYAWPGPFAFTRSSATIRNCIIERSGTTWTFESHAAFFNCIFRRKISFQHGGGVTVDWNSTMLLDGCTFVHNYNHSLSHGGAIYVAPGCEATIRDCLIVANSSADKGGGVYVGGRATIVGTTISDNCASRGGGIYVAGEGPIQGATTIERSIISFNKNYLPDSGGGNVVASCTDMFGNEGGDWVGCLAGQGDLRGNFTRDPRYCDRWPTLCGIGPDPGKYHLDTSSPCAPEHSGGCDLIGALPVACGATAVEEGTWGQIKARFQHR